MAALRQCRMFPIAGAIYQPSSNLWDPKDFEKVLTGKLASFNSVFCHLQTTLPSQVLTEGA
jgi:hypothetical protein